MNILKELWKDKHVSEEMAETYWEYRKNHPGSDPLPPISGRGFLIVIGISLLIITLSIIFL